MLILFNTPSKFCEHLIPESTCRNVFYSKNECHLHSCEVPSPSYPQNKCTCRWNKARRMLIINTFTLNTHTRVALETRVKIDCETIDEEAKNWTVSEEFRSHRRNMVEPSPIQFANKSSLLSCRHRRGGEFGRNCDVNISFAITAQADFFYRLAIFHFFWVGFISSN